jgi:polyphosphate kinase 2 (PPK2 family)
MADQLSGRRRARLAKFIEPFRVAPGRKVRLAKDFDPTFRGGLRNKQQGIELLEEGVALLSEYQARLAAQDSWGVLVVLQALDTAGKDGTIRHVMSGVNPQGWRCTASRCPRPRSSTTTIYGATPSACRRGGRSASSTAPLRGGPRGPRPPREPRSAEAPRQDQDGDVWKRRYREINDWERYLTDSGFQIVKLFLNLSKEEQRSRLLRRIDLPDHNWKFSSADVTERALWDDYQHALSEILSHTSTEWALWHVIPADRKWFARIATACVLANALMEIDPHYPEVNEQQRSALQAVKQQLVAEAPQEASAPAAPARAACGRAALRRLSEIPRAGRIGGCVRRRHHRTRPPRYMRSPSGMALRWCPS